MPADSPLDSVKKTLIDADVLARETDACEADLTALKVAWEQFFLGLERRPPTKQYEEFKKRIQRLKNQFTRSTPVKFRINSVHQKFVSYERLWQRTQQQMEDGTYRRDLFKAKLRSHAGDEKKKSSKKDDFEIEEDLGDMGLDDELDAPPPPPAAAKPAAPAVAPVVPPVGAAKPVPPGQRPTVSAAAIPAKAPAAQPTVARAAAPTAAVKPPPPGPASGDGLSDAKVKAIYDAYVTAKRRCQEDTSKITLESVSATLKKQVPELMKQHNAKGVDFKVVIKDGKALLRAVPKE